MAQILFPGIGAFYNIIKSWYGTSPDTDSYGLNLGSDLTSDQDREITDILRKRVRILSIDFVIQGWIWLQLLDEVFPTVHLLFEHLDWNHHLYKSRTTSPSQMTWSYQEHPKGYRWEHLQFWRFDVQLSDRDTISITIASKRELNILDRLVLQLSVKTELHLLELLEEPEANNLLGTWHSLETWR